VRINSLASKWGQADLTALIDASVAGFVLPKVDNAAAIEEVAQLSGRDDRGLVPLIETATGVLGAAAIAAHPRVIGVALGAEDLGAQLGLRRSRHGHELLFARSHVLMAAVAAGHWALDSPCVEPRDAEATRREALRARGLGYTGKLLIHPAQVAPAHEAFAPSADEVGAARRVLDAHARMIQDGIGVASLEGRMIDRPILLAAQRVLARAGADHQTGDEGA
jgi:citrate lyase beta subunit